MCDISFHDSGVWLGAGGVARKICVAVLEKNVARTLKVPVSKRLHDGTTFYGDLSPGNVIFKALAVDVARIEEVAIFVGVLEKGPCSSVKFCFVLLEKCSSFGRAVWGCAREEIDGLQDCRVVLRVQDKQWCLDVGV